MVYSLCSYIVRMYTNYYLKPSRPLLEPFNENFMTNLPYCYREEYRTTLPYSYSEEYRTTLQYYYSE